MSAEFSVASVARTTFDRLPLLRSPYIQAFLPQKATSARFRQVTAGCSFGVAF
ncbi:hypothetical protein IE4771_PB00013 (plasmid) [Rhizobium etli bv. mimosae str. IE4771]|uniref:Uncharacterized protein n=1 Tax=Rhizobium etli bv. mimosae str. IE4771 TaxID=1432050 RepID=A0A060I3M7_RHIET|nr:hypothetical protein IE4771_PB00013 [Rhizobium sp. IE4771]